MEVRKERFFGWDALVLAGGASRRMGRDKAGLQVDGMPLLELQLRRALEAGAGRLWVSCAMGGPRCELGVDGVHWLVDPGPELGPWPGLMSALGASEAGHLMVLAVDMPALTPGFLGRLLEASGPGMGCVPESVGGLEPLCALYPRAEALREAMGLMEAGHPSPRMLALRGIEVGWMKAMRLSPAEERCLVNWNRPGDWEPATNAVDGRQGQTGRNRGEGGADGGARPSPPTRGNHPVPGEWP